MPTRGRRQFPTILVDTSVSVPLVLVDHTAHQAVTDALVDRTLGLAGHALFETHSVLTRLPGPARRSVSEVSRIVKHNFPETRFLSKEASAQLAGRLGELGIAGGSVYDALVGMTAVEHDLSLATRDTRALDVYRALDVDLILIA